MEIKKVKLITIKRDNVRDVKRTNRPFLAAYQDNLREAMLVLTPAAFKVYICLLFNIDGYRLWFSPENIKSMTGLCKDTIRKALEQLEQQGYLKRLAFQQYIFRENRNTEYTTLEGEGRNSDFELI